MRVNTTLSAVHLVGAALLAAGCATILGIDGDYSKAGADAGTGLTPAEPINGRPEPNIGGAGGLAVAGAPNPGPTNEPAGASGAGGVPALGAGGVPSESNPESGGTAGIGPVGGAAGASGAGGSTSAGASGVSGTGGSTAGSGGSAAGSGGAPVLDEGIVVVEVQSGATTLETGNLSVSSSIRAVDPSRSFLVFGSRFDSTSSSYTEVAGNLADATTVTFDRGASSATAPDVPISYYVAEFERGVNVQRGWRVLSQPVERVTLDAAVDVSKSVPLVTLRNAGADYKADDFVRAELTGPSELSLTTYHAMASGGVEWQVISFEDDVTQVQSDTVMIPATQTSLSVPLARAVEVAKSWLVLSYQLVDVSQQAQAMMVRGFVSSPEELTFERSGMGPEIQLTYHLVTFGGSTQVQSGALTVAAQELSAPVPIAPIDPSKSIALASGGYARAGSTTYSGGVNLGYSTFLLQLASDELSVLRGGNGTGSEAMLNWSVISFP